MRAAPPVLSRDSRRSRDWTKGGIVGNLFSLSWPMMIGGSINMLGPTIDMVWVGKLGAASIAGVGIAGMIVMMVDSLKMGLMTGVRAIIARSIGAGDHEGANHAAQQAVAIAAAFSTMIAVAGIFLARPILLIMGLEPDVVSEGVAYMQIVFIGRIPMGLWMMAEAMMQASGDTVTPMKTTLSFRILHVALAPFLIFGLAFFPRMGVTGAALTNVISQSVGAALGMWFLLSGRTRLKMTFRGFRFDPSMIWRIVKIGIPGSISGMERTFGQTALVWLVAPFGTFAVASHSIMQRTDMFVFVPAMALGNAAGVLAGQNLGAQQPDRASKSAWSGVLLAEILLIACAVLILIRPEFLVRIFNTEPGLVDIASKFMRIAAISYVVTGFSSVLMACLNNVGDTLPPMIVSLLTIWAVQIPLAYVLPRYTDLGVYGVRWAMVCGTILGALTYVIYFRLGRWKHKRV